MIVGEKKRDKKVLAQTHTANLWSQHSITRLIELELWLLNSLDTLHWHMERYLKNKIAMGRMNFKKISIGYHIYSSVTLVSLHRQQARWQIQF